MSKIDHNERIGKATANVLKAAIKFTREKKKSSYASAADLTEACEDMEAAMMDGAMAQLGIELSEPEPEIERAPASIVMRPLSSVEKDIPTCPPDDSPL